MKRLLSKVYLAIYLLVSGKRLKNDRAEFIIALTSGIYILGVYIFIIISLDHFSSHKVLYTLVPISLFFITIKIITNIVNKRDFYVYATKGIKDLTKQQKVLLQIAGLLFSFGSLAFLILSFVLSAYIMRNS